MNEDEISETLDKVVPHRELPEGLLAGARRRRRRTRALTGGAALALVAALAIPISLTVGGAGLQTVATPAHTPSSTSTQREGDGILCPPGDTSPGAALENMTRGYACGPVGTHVPDSNESVQIPLSDDLIADIVQAALSTQRPLDESLAKPDLLPLPFPANVPGLVLLGPDGTSVTMVGTPDGYSWRAPKHMEFTPSRELADRIWEEIGRNSDCSVPGYLYPPDVTVDVYDAGGGEVSVQEVTQHLKQAGFSVTNRGKSPWMSPGGPIGLRGANENESGIDLVSSYLNTLGVGEMARVDDVVDLLVTGEFNDVAEPFASEPMTRVISGRLECTSPSTSVTPSEMPAPVPEPSYDVSPGGGGAAYDEQCTVDADGRMATSELPGNTLPDGPEAVWLCSGVASRAPFEPLVGKESLQQLIDSFRRLSTTPVNDRETPLTSVNSYLVFTYADGQRYTVRVDLFNSLQVLWGSEQQHVGYGTLDWLYGLDKLWVTQRDENPQNPPLPPRAGVCVSMHSSLGRAMDRYDVDGALCTVVRKAAGGVKGVRIPAPEQLIADVRMEAQRSSVAWAPTDLDPNPILHWDGDSVMLVDDYGDRLPLLRVAPDTWRWQQGEKVWDWTPTPELSTRLNRAFDEGRPSPQPTHS
ncbi:MAG: hypothetical protein ABIS84_03055 [Arachnia sp.]